MASERGATALESEPASFSLATKEGSGGVGGTASLGEAEVPFAAFESEPDADFVLSAEADADLGSFAKEGLECFPSDSFEA